MKYGTALPPGRGTERGLHQHYRVVNGLVARILLKKRAARRAERAQGPVAVAACTGVPLPAGRGTARQRAQQQRLAEGAARRAVDALMAELRTHDEAENAPPAAEAPPPPPPAAAAPEAEPAAADDGPSLLEVLKGMHTAQAGKAKKAAPAEEKPAEEDAALDGPCLMDVMREMTKSREFSVSLSASSAAPPNPPDELVADVVAPTPPHAHKPARPSVAQLPPTPAPDRTAAEAQALERALLAERGLKEAAKDMAEMEARNDELARALSAAQTERDIMQAKVAGLASYEAMFSEKLTETFKLESELAARDARIAALECAEADRDVARAEEVLASSTQPPTPPQSQSGAAVEALQAKVARLEHEAGKREEVVKRLEAHWREENKRCRDLEHQALLDGRRREEMAGELAELDREMTGLRADAARPESPGDTVDGALQAALDSATAQLAANQEHLDANKETIDALTRRMKDSAEAAEAELADAKAGAAEAAALRTELASVTAQLEGAVQARAEAQVQAQIAEKRQRHAVAEVDAVKEQLRAAEDQHGREMAAADTKAADLMQKAAALKAQVEMATAETLQAAAAAKEIARLKFENQTAEEAAETAAAEHAEAKAALLALQQQDAARSGALEAAQAAWDKEREALAASVAELKAQVAAEAAASGDLKEQLKDKEYEVQLKVDERTLQLAKLQAPKPASQAPTPEAEAPQQLELAQLRQENARLQKQLQNEEAQRKLECITGQAAQIVSAAVAQYGSPAKLRESLEAERSQSKKLAAANTHLCELLTQRDGAGEGGDDDDAHAALFGQPPRASTGSVLSVDLCTRLFQGEQEESPVPVDDALPSQVPPVVSSPPKLSGGPASPRRSVSFTQETLHTPESAPEDEDEHSPNLSQMVTMTQDEEPLEMLSQKCLTQWQAGRAEKRKYSDVEAAALVDCLRPGEFSSEDVAKLVEMKFNTKMRLATNERRKQSLIKEAAEKLGKDARVLERYYWARKDEIAWTAGGSCTTPRRPSRSYSRGEISLLKSAKKEIPKMQPAAAEELLQTLADTFGRTPLALEKKMQQS